MQYEAVIMIELNANYESYANIVYTCCDLFEGCTASQQSLFDGTCRRIGKFCLYAFDDVLAADTNQEHVMFSTQLAPSIDFLDGSEFFLC